MFEAEGVEALEGVVLEIVVKFDSEFMISKFAAEGIVSAYGTNDVFETCGLIIHQRSIGLNGGEAGQFLLVALVVGSQSQGVMPHGVGDGGNHAILSHHYARTRILQAGVVAHLVVEAEAVGESTHLYGGELGCEVDELSLVLAGLVAARNVRIAVLGTKHVTPRTAKVAPRVELKASEAHEVLADALVALR